MSLNSRLVLRLRPAISQLARSRWPQRAFVGTKNPNPPPPIEPSDAQSQPLGAYYESILNTPQPIPDVKKEEPPQSSVPKQKEKEKEQAAEKEDGAPSPPAPEEKKPGTKTKPGRKPKDTPTSSAAAAAAATSVPEPPITPEDRARIVFGSTLVGPAERAERLAAIRSRSTLVAGILVPPRPDEPDNCCMSGCVNCVWDRYREDVETWSAATAESQARLKAQHGEQRAAAMSMDEDGGGSERSWDVGPARITKDLWDEELYKDVPVGIREFMRQEKKLKERHAREGTSGG